MDCRESTAGVSSDPIIEHFPIFWWGDWTSFNNCLRFLQSRSRFRGKARLPVSKFASGCAACLVALVSLSACGSDDGARSVESVAEGAPAADGGATSADDVDATKFCGVAVDSGTDADLASDLNARAESFRSVADDMPADLQAALRTAADAMGKLSQASKDDPTGGELAKLVEELSGDVALTDAQQLIEKTVAEKCTSTGSEG